MNACSGGGDVAATAGLPIGVIGSRGRLPGHFSAPRGLDVAPDGRFAVADRTGRIQIFSGAGETLGHWRLPEFENGTPTGLAFDASSGAEPTILLADTHYSRILRYSTEGQLLQEFGEYGDLPGQMIYPTDVAVDPEGNLYVTEYGVRDRVIKFSAAGEFLFEWGDFGTAPGEFQRPLALLWLPSGRVLVADSCNHRLQLFGADGGLIEVWGEVGDGPGQFKYPYDIALMSDGSIAVCEYGNNRLQFLSPEGEFLGFFGDAGREPGRFATPWGVASSAGGKLYVADTGNHRIQILSEEVLRPALGGEKTSAAARGESGEEPDG